MVQLAKATSGNKFLGGIDPVDERVACFHTSFYTRGYWPDQCDTEACQRYLWECYENSRCDLEKEFVELGQPLIFDEYDIAKRVGRPTPETAAWYEQAIPGSVNFHGVRYNDRIVHSFGNCPPQKVTLRRGATHVALGFADLGELSQARLTGKKGRVTWVGYDQSPYAIAKTLVILKMMHGSATVDDILQVWYSSAWSQHALTSFREDLSRIELAPLSPEVQALLVHWEQHDVSLRRSRQVWLDDHTTPKSIVANFKDEVHTLAFCSYMICGQLLQADVGSVTMYAIPSNIGTLSLQESIFEVLNLSEVLKRAGNKSDIVSAAIDILREQISTLRERLRSCKIVAEVRLASVEHVVQEITELNPKTVSWSNL